jgi:hypothetical protein
MRRMRTAGNWAALEVCGMAVGNGNVNSELEQKLVPKSLKLSRRSALLTTGDSFTSRFSSLSGAYR